MTLARRLIVAWRLRLLAVRQRIGLALSALPVSVEDAKTATRLLILAFLATCAVTWGAAMVVLVRQITGYG